LFDSIYQLKITLAIINIIMKINTEIPGYMSARELKIIALAASMIEPGKDFLEIGAFLGRTSWVISQNLPDSASLTCVDQWRFSSIYNPEKIIFKNCDSSVEQKNFARELAIEKGSWKPVFEHYTRYCLNITAKQTTTNLLSLDKEYSMIFLDGDHKFEQVDADLSKIDYSPDVLLFGDDFTWMYKDVVAAVCKAQGTHNRILIRLPKTKLWFLWPTQGYYKDLLGQFFTQINNLTCTP
jgi:predicted O-methyltransferase YrrM